MFKVLRILFCVLAVLGATATVFIFIYFGIWGILPLSVACVSAALMIFFKRKQEYEEAAKNPTPVGDFITGKPNDKENEEAK